MVFRGKVRSVGALLEAACTAPQSAATDVVGVRRTAADNARLCAALREAGETTEACWRFGILQTLDDYTSVLLRGGPELAQGVFADEPPRTGSRDVDASFAALADYLAERDGWPAATWVGDTSRVTSGWYPGVPVIFRADAEQESPPAFRHRGILITSRSLARA